MTQAPYFLLGGVWGWLLVCAWFAANRGRMALALEYLALVGLQTAAIVLLIWGGK